MRLCCTVLLVLAVGTRPAVADEPQRTVTGEEALQQLLNGGSLKLSSDQSSAETRFSAMLHVSVPRKQEAALISRIVILRDDQKSLVLVTVLEDGKAIPCCCLADGMMVGVDPDKPGGLVVAENVAPRVVWAHRKGATGDEFDLIVGAIASKRPQIELDLGAILKALSERITRSSFDPRRRIISWEADERSGQILLAKPDEKLPIGVGEFSLKQSGAIVAVAVDSLKPSLGEPILSEDRIGRLAAPRRKWTPDANASFKVLPPVRLSGDKRFLQAAQELGKLVKDVVDFGGDDHK